MKEKEKTLPKRTPGGTAFKHARAYRGVYLMATPVLVSALIFYYLPMFGIRYAFFTYKGINDPIFIGIKHFVKMFSMPDRKSTRLNSSHSGESRMPSSA